MIICKRPAPWNDQQKKNGDGIEEGEEGKREGGERGEEILAHGRAGGHTNQR